MSAVEALALLASAVFLARLLPQPVRLARHGVAAGVSPLAALNAVVSAVAWIAYGLAAHLPVVWGVSVLALIPGIWQAVLLRRQVRSSDLAWSGVFAAALAVAASSGLLGMALGGTVLVTAGPQLRTALISNDLSGLAPATWKIAIVDAVTWGLYGAAIGDGALVGYFVVLLATSVVVLGRIAWTARPVDAADAYGDFA